MKKILPVELEVCEQCEEREVAYNRKPNNIVKCEWCGKLLCSMCLIKINWRYVCPDCDKEIFTEYYKILDEINELKCKIEKMEDDKDIEWNRIIKLIKYS